MAISSSAYITLAASVCFVLVGSLLYFYILHIIKKENKMKISLNTFLTLFGLAGVLIAGTISYFGTIWLAAMGVPFILILLGCAVLGYFMGTYSIVLGTYIWEEV